MHIYSLTNNIIMKRKSLTESLVLAVQEATFYADSNELVSEKHPDVILCYKKLESITNSVLSYCKDHKFKLLNSNGIDKRILEQVQQFITLTIRDKSKTILPVGVSHTKVVGYVKSVIFAYEIKNPTEKWPLTVSVSYDGHNIIFTPESGELHDYLSKHVDTKLKLSVAK